MIAGPEQARLMSEFEAVYMHTDSEDTDHHEHEMGAIKAFNVVYKVLIALYEP